MNKEEGITCVSVSWENYLLKYTDKFRKLLKEAGCKCNLPLLGYRPNKGPRCRLCNTEAIDNE